MRNYEHFKVDGQILIPDHKSAKAAYGLDSPEFLEQHDPKFLREGHSTVPNKGLVFQLTEEDKTGRIVAEKEQCDGGYSEMKIPENKVAWKRG